MAMTPQATANRTSGAARSAMVATPTARNGMAGIM